LTKNIKLESKIKITVNGMTTNEYQSGKETENVFIALCFAINW